MKSIFNHTSIHEMLSYLILNQAFSKREVASCIQVSYREINTALKNKHRLIEKSWTKDVVSRLQRFYVRLYLSEQTDSRNQLEGDH